MDPGQPPASELLAAMTAEMVALYGAADRLDHPRLDPAEMAAPAGTYLVGVDGTGTPVAGGGLRRLTDEVAEIKRMYVVPAERGHGVAGRLLTALEEAGRRLGYRLVRLDTGPRKPHARRLYESAGYQPIAAYNDNPYAAFFGEKPL